MNALAGRRGRTPPLELGPRARLWVPVAVTLPAAVALAVLEHRGGSPGKRALDLSVQPWPGGRSVALPFGRAVLRSLLKTALPWELGHQSVWQLRAGRNVSGGLLAAAAQLLLIAQGIGSLGGGRTYPDRLAGTVVVAVRPGRSGTAGRGRRWPPGRR